jgi:hypothetical protein
MNKEQDPEVAETLSLIRLCQSVGALPMAGGLLDQDSYFIYLLEQVMLIDQEKEERDRKKADRN